jgi:hypothetical protein
MLDSLTTRYWEIILTNMRQSVTLRILMSLYPRADLDVVGMGFTVTCSDEEALKVIEDNAVTVVPVVDYARSRPVPRVDCDVITLNAFESFLHVAILL